MLKSFRDYIASKDEIVEPSALKLHFNEDYKIKTFFGGFFSLMIQGMVASIVVTKSIKMFNSEDPSMSSVEFKIDEDQVVPFADVAKIIFQIWDGDST